MSYKPRRLVDEHLVRRDEDGYSLDHCLVSDTNRSLIKEMDEMAKLVQRIRSKKQLNAKQTYVDQITAKDIETLLNYEIEKKEANKSSNTETRKLIDYNDLLI